LFDELSKKVANSKQVVQNSFPFLEYAVRNVLYHAELAEGSGIAQGGFIQSFPHAD